MCRCLLHLLVSDCFETVRHVRRSEMSMVGTVLVRVPGGYVAYISQTTKTLICNTNSVMGKERVVCEFAPISRFVLFTT